MSGDAQGAVDRCSRSTGEQRYGQPLHLNCTIYVIFKRRHFFFLVLSFSFPAGLWSLLANARTQSDLQNFRGTESESLLGKLEARSITY